MKTDLFGRLRNSLGQLAFFKANKTVVAILVVVIVGALSFGAFSEGKPEVETTMPLRTTIMQTVKVTGKVQAAKEANLAFQSSGTVSYIGVKIGDTIPAGKVLATLSSLDEQANVLQAEASLENAKATFDQLTQGSRKEEIDLKQQTLTNAQSSLDAVYETLPDAVRNVDAVTADSIKNKLASLFLFSGDHYVLSFSTCDQKLQSTVESSRSALENTLASFQKISTTITPLSSKTEIDSAFMESYKVTIATNNLIATISSLLLESCSTQNTALDSYRTALASVRVNMNTLFADISAKRSSLTSAKNAVAQAERDLALTNAGTDQGKIKAQAALVSQAQANVAAAKARLSRTMLIAPFDGVITNVSLVSGETASSLKTVISMISMSAFEVEASIPEIDIAKIGIHNEVAITLDAYGSGVNFPATITRIDPAATFEGNVPKYKVVATFTHEDERIKTGMTANISIIAKKIENALTLPVRFVHAIDESHGEVTVKENENTKLIPVLLGVRGEDGLLEIVGGLAGNETVVAIQPGVREAQKMQ